MITGILIAAALVGGTGLVIGLLLGVAGKKFAVEVNEKEIAVREQLPGNNCGGCGYPGCDGLAAAIAAGRGDKRGIYDHRTTASFPERKSYFRERSSRL